MTKDEQSRLDKLLAQLDLEQLDNDLFVGEPEGGQGRMFGGFVLAQSVISAYRTVETRAIHSVHAYFLRMGKKDVPIRYVVYRIRDGGSFTTRNVVAYQSGEAIFNLSASFVKPEEGMEYQERMPDVPAPEGLGDWRMNHGQRSERIEQHHWTHESPVEMVSWQAPEEREMGDTPPNRGVWMRVRGTFPDEPMLHAALLTYASDSGVVSTGRPPNLTRAGGFGASLDHTMWFHRPPKFDDWVLYTSEAPAAFANRALVFGAMFTRGGVRVASVAQEGLHRGPRPS